MRSGSTREPHDGGTRGARDERVQGERSGAIAGRTLAELLRATREPLLRALETKPTSKEYRRHAGFILDEFARFCEGQAPAHPWLLRHDYLTSRAELRSHQPFSASYLIEHGRQLRYFLRWYLGRVRCGRVGGSEPPTDLLAAYWSAQPEALPYRHRILRMHIGPLLQRLGQSPPIHDKDEIESLVSGYLEQRRKEMRGNGYGFVLRHRAAIVTRRHLHWLEQQGHLPAGAAAQGAEWCTDAARHEQGAEGGESESQALLHYVRARVDPALPLGLRQPLREYLEHLVSDRSLTGRSIESSLRANLALCRKIAQSGRDSFSSLRISLIDEVVASLLRAPVHDLLHRRQQVRAQHSRLRGFLRYLYRHGLIPRDLAPALISPPCYRASTPMPVLSEEQIQCLLDSVTRCSPRGRRCYAIVTLMTTYGLRPVDVCRLRLEQLRWREERIELVQSKTGRLLALPLVPQVAAALKDYLRHDRPPGLGARQVFVSLDWPHRPVRSVVICSDVNRALSDCGLGWARARHLRATVATHLLRQGEPLSMIQELLGHRTAETTQRYAVTDLQMLRQVLQEKER